MATEVEGLYGTSAFTKQFGSLAKFEQGIHEQAARVASGGQTWEDWLLTWTMKARTTSGTQEFSDEQQRQLALAQQAKTPQEIAEKLFEQAHGDYFISLSKADALNWANNIMNGKSSYGEFDDYLRKQASTLYPFYKDSINNGVLPKTLFGPAMNSLSNELEMSPEQVQADPKMWGEITAQAAGSKAPFTASDWIQYARNLPQYKATQGAAQLTSDFASTILKEFGAIG
jgi:hypothetical protein